MKYIEGDIFEIDSKEYKLRIINSLGGCWLEPVIYRSGNYCVTSGMNKCCGYEELKNFKYIARI